MAKAEREILNAFVDGQELVRLYRHEDGRVYANRRPAEYAGFLRREDVSPEMLRALRGSAVIRGIREDGAYWRLLWTSYEARKAYVTHPDSPLVREGIAVYEGDVDPARRHFTDTETRIAKPRRCYLDIETDSRVSFADKEQMRVLTWAVVCHETGEAWSGCLDEWSDKAERRLLDALWKALDPFDQVVGWYLDGFDAPVIFARSRHHKVNVDARRWLYVDQLEVYKRLNHAESGEEKRSMKLEDIGQAVTGRGKLKPPAWVVERFGDRSMGALSYELWEAGGRFRELLVEYNVRDTALLRDIEGCTGFLDLFETICEVCRLFASTSALNPTRQMDGFMLKLGAGLGYRFPTKEYRETAVQFKGAYVMKPDDTLLSQAWRAKHGMEDGIARSVHVCDYTAMYPSIILTYNMSPETKVEGPINGPIAEGTCRAPLTGICFRTDVEGILPKAIKVMMGLRKKWSALKETLPAGTPEWHHADRMSTAYKVAVNAFYGVVGSPFSRFFDKSIAESVTQAGSWMMKRTLYEAGQKGFQVLYSDTDSAFVMNATRETFRDFVQWCNEDLYPRLLTGQGCRENHVRLAYEKELDRLVMVAAKKYAASYRHHKWITTCSCDTPKGPGAFDVRTMTCRHCGVVRDELPPIRSAPEIKGLEYMRGDALEMAANLQATVIGMLVGGLSGEAPTTDMERYHGVLSRARARILEEPLELAVVKQSKALSKPLKSYAAKKKKDGEDASQPPHVMVAHVLKARGQDVREGTRIEYFVVDGASAPMKVAPAEDWKGECDRYFLWESLVFPPTQRLLESAFPGRGWDEWAKVRPAKVRETKATRLAAAQPSLFPDPPPPKKGRARPVTQQTSLLEPSPGMAQRRKGA